MCGSLVRRLFTCGLLGVMGVMGVMGDDPDEVCYGDFGCFSLAPPWNRTVDREGNIVFRPRPAPPPHSPSFLDTRVILYTRANVHHNGSVIYQEMVFVNESLHHYRCGHQNHMLVHGYGAHCAVDYLVGVRDAFLADGDHNVLMVCWHTLSGPDDYAQSVSDTRVVGVAVAKVVQQLRATCGPHVYVHVAGHSLGAQISGYAGKHVLQVTGVPIQLITGMDPAGIGFTDVDPRVRLGRRDAAYVCTIHTDMHQLGSTGPDGDVDLYVNNGHDQPGCESSVPLEQHGCSHVKATTYLSSALGTSGCTFWGSNGRPHSQQLTAACRRHQCSSLRHPEQLPGCGAFLVDTTKACTAEDAFLEEYRKNQSAVAHSCK